MILCARISVALIAVVPGVIPAHKEVLLFTMGAPLDLCVEKHFILCGTTRHEVIYVLFIVS